MPVQTTQSPLMKKYGAKLDEAARKHAGDTTTAVGIRRVPPGIRNGVAQLTDCGFGIVAQGKANAGEWYFRAEGVVVEPKTVVINGQTVDCEGCQTSVIEMVCATMSKANKPTSHEEHVARIWTYLRGLGAVTEGLGGADLERVAAAVKDTAPFFNFSTSLGKPSKEYPEPLVFENWHGGDKLTDYSPGMRNGTVDNTGASPFQSDSPPDAAPDGDNAPAGDDAPADDDFDGLVEYWNGLDDGELKDSINDKLTDLAVSVGCDRDAVTGAADWDEVKALMEAASAESGDATPDEPFEPVKAGVYGLEVEVLKDAKNPKKGKVKKKVQVVVLTVDKKGSTVTLQDNATKKTIMDEKTKKAKAYPWADLIVE